MKNIFEQLSSLNSLTFIKYKDLDWYEVTTTNFDGRKYNTKYVSYHNRYHNIAICIAYAVYPNGGGGRGGCDERRRFA